MSKRLRDLFSYKNESIYWILLFVLTGFGFSFTQVLGESPDYTQYESFFELLVARDIDAFEVSRFEWGFTALSLLFTASLPTIPFVYSAIVMLAMFLKGSSIYVLSTTRAIFLFAAIFYLVRFFPLHELTQLRAAMAIAFLLVAAVFLWSGNTLYGVLAVACAALFHTSSIALAPLLFFKPIQRRRVAFLTGLAALLLALIGNEAVSASLADFLVVFDTYQVVGFGDDKPNPFAAALLLDWLMIITALAMWYRLSLLMQRVILIEMIGMALFYGSLDYPIIAHRLREMYSVFWLFFVADGLGRSMVRIPAALFATASIALYSYYFVFSGEFFH